MSVRTIALIAAFLLSPVAFAQKPTVFSDRDGAIRGHDPVAYFDRKGPVKGSKQFSHPWGGATWHFASAENRDKLAATPEKYAPQYGGYCAYAVAQGPRREREYRAGNECDRGERVADDEHDG